MKKSRLILTFLVFAGTCSRLAAQSFTIKGEVKGLTEKSRVYLVDGNNESDTVAQGIVRNSAFTLSGKLGEPSLLKLGFTGPVGAKPVFIGNESMQLSGESSNLRGLKITGSPSQNDFDEFERISNPYLKKLNALSQLGNSPAGAGKGDSISREYSYTITKLRQELGTFVESRPSSFVSAFVLVVLSQLSENVFMLEKQYNSLAANVQGSAMGLYIKEQISVGKIGAVGTEAIDFTQNDTLGRPVSLSSFRGKYVLVDFWASWCGPCRQENPNVLATYEKFKSKNFTILGVSLDRSRDPWIKAIHDDGLAWVQVSDLKFWNNEAAVKYKIASIPQNLLVDPEGKIVARNLRGPELQSKLCELLGCN